MKKTVNEGVLWVTGTVKRVGVESDIASTRVETCERRAAAIGHVMMSSITYIGAENPAAKVHFQHCLRRQ
jgi:hypothetical protein